MTYDNIVDRIRTRLNLTSTDSLARIQITLNDRIREVSTSIGLDSSRLVVTDVTYDPLVDTDLPEITLQDFNKILKIELLNDTPQVRVLKQLTYDEITNNTEITRLPRAWAVKRMNPSSVTLVLDSSPDESFSLRFEGYEVIQDLSGTDEPPWPEDFHDILIFGTMSEELYKMEKYPYAQEMERKYQTRLSDLRMYIAKSGYLDIVQGKDRPRQLWYRPWFSRTSMWE